MKGYFTLKLDTTPPRINIYMPRYTTNNNEVEIVVHSEDYLYSGFQDFYIIDQFGVRHDYIFSFVDGDFVGSLVLSGINNGLVTFYARVKDSVHNFSELVSQTIEVIPSVNYLRMSIDDSIHTFDSLLFSSYQRADISNLSMGYKSEIYSSEMSTMISTKHMEAGISDESNKSNIYTEVVVDNG
jgi:hypothetical protein